MRLHTEFSVVDGTCRIDDVVKAASRDHQPALAITDLSNLFGAIKFYKEARKRGVKPLIGSEIWLEGLGKEASALSRVLLLVQNQQGYLNLSELLARAWTQSSGRAQAVVRLDWLRERHGGASTTADLLDGVGTHQHAPPAGRQPIDPDQHAMALAVGRELRRPDA